LEHVLPNYRGIGWLVTVSYSYEISPRMDSSSKVVMLFGSHEKFSGVEISSNPAIIQCIEITLFSIDFGEVV
jgi:hypothetical protein